jgi:hypothetical protein
MFRCGVLSGVFCVWAAAIATAPVQVPDTTVGPTRDSAQVIVLDPGLSLGKPTLLLPPALREEGALVVPPLVEGAGFGATGLPFLLPGTPPPLDLMVSYRLQHEREQELSTLRSVLGTVQLGAVGYVAYLHLKKRGVFR